MKLGIIGSRNFKDYNFFLYYVNKFIEKYGKPTLIVTGDAKGVDTFAAKYANDNKIELKKFFANWSLGKKAGPLRNIEIVNNADVFICFPSIYGIGTQDTINKINKYNINNEKKKIIEIIYID